MWVSINGSGLRVALLNGSLAKNVVHYNAAICKDQNNNANTFSPVLVPKVPTPLASGTRSYTRYTLAEQETFPQRRARPQR